MARKQQQPDDVRDEIVRVRLTGAALPWLGASRPTLPAPPYLGGTIEAASIATPPADAMQLLPTIRNMVRWSRTVL